MRQGPARVPILNYYYVNVVTNTITTRRAVCVSPSGSKRSVPPPRTLGVARHPRDPTPTFYAHSRP
eukprot:4667424-Prymnesium_polylepis.1